MLGNILGVDEYLSKNVCWNHELELNVLSIITPISFNQNMCTNTNVWGVNVRMHKKNVYKHGALVCTPILIKKDYKTYYRSVRVQVWTILNDFEVFELYGIIFLSFFVYFVLSLFLLWLSWTISDHLGQPQVTQLYLAIKGYLELS